MKVYILCTGITFLLVIFSVEVFAQKAKVVGPQSVIEKYDAPTAESDSGGIIDFPSMIAAPGANDSLRILSSVTGLALEFMDEKPKRPNKIKQGGLKGKDFVRFLGKTKVSKNKSSLLANLAKKLSVYRDLPLTLGDVRFIQQDITEVYQELGYPLMSVVVPPQEIVAGIVQVQINEFRLSTIDVSYGDKNNNFSSKNPHWSSDKRVRNILSPLLTEAILNKSSLDKSIKRLNQNPYRSARVVFEPGIKLGQSKANIQISEKRPWGLRAGYNNHATESSGEHRFSVGANVGNLPFEDHQLSFNAVVGTEIDEFENYSLIYKIPNRFGHTFTLNGNFSDTSSSSIPGIDSASTTSQITAAYDFPLGKGDNWSWSGSSSFSFKQFERDSLFGGTSVGGAEFDAFDLALRLTYNLKESLASNQFTLSATKSFSGRGGNNTIEDFQRFYNRAEGDSDYIFWGVNYARVQPLSFLGSAWKKWSAESQISVQVADEALAGSDQFSVGGANVLRAYQSSEIAGDKGEYITQFFHSPAIQAESLGALGHLIKSIQISVFIEAGTARQDLGEKETLWDYGVQGKFQLLKKSSCTASLGIAGEETINTAKNDTRFFIGCVFNY